jgi:hypothetical protein
LEEAQKIIQGFEEKMTEDPYSNFKEIKYYFDEQKSIWDIYKKLETDKTYEEFANKTLATMKQISPMSQAIIFQNIN